jgi:hypothetical protein
VARQLKSRADQGINLRHVRGNLELRLPTRNAVFVDSVLGKVTCMESCEDGHVVLKIVYATYQSAGEGCDTEFPCDPPQVEKPIDLRKKVKRWK